MVAQAGVFPLYVWRWHRMRLPWNRPPSANFRLGRQTVFGNRRARAAWIGVGLVLAAVATLSIWPTLQNQTTPARPWSVAAVSEEGSALTEGFGSQTVRMWLRTGPECSNPVHISGAVIPVASHHDLYAHGFDSSLFEGRDLIRSMNLAVAGLAANHIRMYPELFPAGSLDPEAASIAARLKYRLRPKLRRNDGPAPHGVTVRTVKVLRGTYWAGWAFSMRANVAARAGFQRCTVTVPQLVPVQDQKTAIDVDSENAHDALSFVGFLGHVTSATATVYAAGWSPVTGSLPAGALVAPSIASGARDDNKGPVVRIGCVSGADLSDSNLDSLAHGYLNAGCEAAVAFEKPGTPASTSRRTFLSGLLFSAALTLLLEGLFLGREGAAESLGEAPFADDSCPPE